jgi:two-component system, chemotaxis family, CheB/CheR fusion protein
MKNVLIVDDEPDAADTLAALLQLEGFVPHVAYNAKEAIAKAVACNPDAFILDIQLPQMDGFQLANRLRAMPQFNRKRYIALSGFQDQEHLDRASNLGFDDYLVKPCKMDVLLAILRETAHHVEA